jgi:hypothetical protein
MTNLTDRECPHGALTETCPECSLVEPLVASIALVRERDALREALEFYANRDNYCRPYIQGAYDHDPRTFCAVIKDCGAIAIAALKAAQP